MARLAIRVALVHRKAYIVLRACGECPVAGERARGRTGRSWGEEGITALRAKEVLLMVRALAQLGVVERDEALVHNRGLAVVTSRREVLCIKDCHVQVSQRSSGGGQTNGQQSTMTHLMVVEMAVRPPFVRVRAEVLQQLVAHTAPETPRVPPHVHRAHDATYNRTAAPATHQSAALRRLQARIRERLLHFAGLRLLRGR